MPAFDLPHPSWRKSSYSGGNEGGSNCVEVASHGGLVGVRDSKNPGGGQVPLSPAGWHVFIASVKTGTFHTS
jgi:Domain of unknown function (DUF397)